MYIFSFIVFRLKQSYWFIVGLKNDVTSQKSKLVAGSDEQDIFKKFVARKKKSNMTPKFSRTQSTAMLCISCFFSYKKRRENCWVYKILWNNGRYLEPEPELGSALHI